MSTENHYINEVEPIKEKEYNVFKKHHKIAEAADKLVRVGLKRYVLPEHFLINLEEIRSLTLRSDDVFVLSYPRSGATWTKDLVWLVANDLNFEKATSIPLGDRVPFLEFSIFLPRQLSKNDPQLKWIEEASQTKILDFFHNIKTTKAQRFFHSHIPLSLLSDNLVNTCKVIYVARDIRDVAVSSFHFFKAFKLVGVKSGSFKSYYEEVFSKDLCYYSPYFEHIKEGWELRNHPNVLFLFYEELSKDLKNVAKRVADFLEKKYTDQQFDQLCEHLKFDNFQKNKAVDCALGRELKIVDEGQNFIRKGKVGGWREHFDEQMTRHADNWIIKELQGTGLGYPQ